MTDQELNLAIMKKLGLAPIESWITSHDNGVTTSECTYKADPTNYCNNWNDLMPLVVEHDICFLCPDRYEGETEWIANTFSDDIQTVGTPQRALAECLLKVLTTKS